MKRSSSSWALPAATDAELQRREEAERRREVLRRLGLLSPEGIYIRRRLSALEVASAHAAGIEVDSSGRVLS